MSAPTRERTKKRSFPDRRRAAGNGKGSGRGRIGRIAGFFTAPRLALLFVLAAAAVFTGYNIFNFPEYEVDEGIYLGSAWGMFNEGTLSYYAYNYDHPPLGWSLIGAWAKAVGGFLAFDNAVNTGRVFMLLVAVLSTFFVFQIVRRATGSVAAAVLSGIVFAASPLGIGLHRQVYLDNIATLFLLISVYALVVARGRLWYIVLSVLAFGLAFWSKEIFAVFLPGLLYLAWAVAAPGQRRFGLTLWAGAAFSAFSFFILMAVLKGELLPPGALWTSNEERVSLLETYAYQSQRGGGGSFFSADSEIRTFLGQWINVDPLIMLGGLAATVAGLLFIRRDRLFFGVSLLTLTFVLFLGRGGVTLYFYVIPLIALFAIALGLAAGHLRDAFVWLGDRFGNRFGNWVEGRFGRLFGGFWSGGSSRNAAVAAFAVIILSSAVLVGAASAFANQNQFNFTNNETEAQREAENWVADNITREAFIVMDPYAWVDLREPSFTGGVPFENVHYPTAVRDPAVRVDILEDDWRNIDYMVLSETSAEQIRRGDDRQLPIIQSALQNSDEIKSFEAQGMTMNVYRVRNLPQTAQEAVPTTKRPILEKTWEGYKERFITAEGRVVDPQSDGITTSEGQAYALLRAVYADDEETFDQVWDWTQENLQVRPDDNLLSWQWGPDSGVIEDFAAADAEEDAALALLFASKRWDDSGYENDARAMLDSMWEEETAEVNGQRVLTAGDWATDDASGSVIVNPSYFAPYAYRIFAEADPSRDWEELTDSSYDVLNRIEESPEFGDGSGLPPDWVALDRQTGEVSPADNVIGQGASEASYDASRVPWRISLDWLWFQDSRALEESRELEPLESEYERTGELRAAYNPDGSAATDEEALSFYAGVVPGMLIDEDKRYVAHEIYAEKILDSYTQDGDSAYWGEPDNYYNQNLSWFASAVANGSMGNLWEGEEAAGWNNRDLPEPDASN